MRNIQSLGRSSACQPDAGLNASFATPKELLLLHSAFPGAAEKGRCCRAGSMPDPRGPQYHTHPAVIPGAAAPALPPSCAWEGAEHIPGSIRARTRKHPCSSAACLVSWSWLLPPGKVLLSWAQPASSSLLLLFCCPSAGGAVSAVSGFLCCCIFFWERKCTENILLLPSLVSANQSNHCPKHKPHPLPVG